MLTLTRSLFADLYNHLFNEALPEQFLFGVRGAVPSSPGSLTLVPVSQQLDQYDDAIGFMVDGHGHAYHASVDPGRYFTRHPMEAGGCAHVIEGRYAFAKGAHRHEPRAWKGRNVRCWRDRNRSGVQDPAEQQVFVVQTSIDLHYGGRGNSVGEFSAGCQVVRQPSWDIYRDLTYSLFGERAEYWLLSFHALNEAQSSQPSPSVAVNGVFLPRTCPVWISDQLHLVGVARDLLAHLQRDGQPLEFTFRAEAPPSLVFAPEGSAVPGKLVDNRLVCEVAALLRTLDPSAEIEWLPAQKQARVTSTRLRAATPSPQAVAELPEVNDETPIPDSV